MALTHAYAWPEVRRGAERIIHELSRALSRRGHDVTVFTAGSERARLRDEGVRTVKLRAHFPPGPRYEAEFGLRLVPLLAGGRFDVVHSLAPLDAVASMRAARVHPRRRTVYTNLGLPLREWWSTRYDRRAHERVVERIDVYGCMSKFALGELYANYGRVGTLTPGGVDMARFQPAARREAEPTILFSGAVAEPHKGLRTLLAALPLVARDEPGVRLWISGPGDAAPLLREAPAAARERTVVLPLGHPQDQSDRYARAWATALPSQGDSFGMVLIESLACGTPIVASTHSALPELVTPGMTGALCEPHDPPSVAAAAVTALRLAREAGTVTACRASVERFDWDASLAPLLEEIYAG